MNRRPHQWLSYCISIEIVGIAKTMNTEPAKASIQSLVMLASTLLLCPFASAAGYLWNNPAPGASNWNFTGSWTPGTGNPSAADTANFCATGTSSDALTVKQPDDSEYGFNQLGPRPDS